MCESVPDDRVRERDPRAVEVAIGHDRREVLEVDLVDDARARRDDAQVAERGLGPAQELVALAVALVLPGHVEREGAGRPELVDLHRVVDDEVRGDERIHARGIAAQVRHRVAHRGEVDDRRHAGEVLEQDAGGHERDLRLGRRARAPGGERLDVGRVDQAAAGMAERVLEQDLQRDGRVLEVDPIGQRGEPPVVRQAGAEGGAGSEWIWAWHAGGPRRWIDSTRGIVPRLAARPARP